jgi:hypothetical protein
VRLVVTAPCFYHFELRIGGAPDEDLGGITLNDDADAMAFGKGLVRDLMRDPARPSGCAVSITQGERAVGNLTVA